MGAMTRIYAPGRSRIARMIRRREQLRALRQRADPTGTGAAIADQLESFGRALDDPTAASRSGASQSGANQITPAAGDDDQAADRDPWWNR